MSDGLRVQCPHCSVTLKIKAVEDVDQRKLIKCPKCQSAFSVGDGIQHFNSGAASPEVSQIPVSRKPSASPPVPKATKASKEAPDSTASAGARKRRRPAAARSEANEWDDGGGDLFGGVSSEGSAYGDEWGGGDSAGDPYQNDAYGTSPSRKRSPSSNGRKPASVQRTELPGVRRMGFFGWILFGGLAGSWVLVCRRFRDSPICRL
ncbi:MAG: hypothetical protein JNL58_03515 [Planctomyces sp.]|nr:hypothetical protein [Planctomyces sp.]